MYIAHYTHFAGGDSEAHWLTPKMMKKYGAHIGYLPMMLTICREINGSYVYGIWQQVWFMIYDRHQRLRK